MTDLPLSTYIKAARESAGGVIRESSEDRTKLVNKGTLGHWIATKLDWGDSGTRGDRNERAVEGFRQALVDRYGSTIAEEALKAAGLDGDIETLTGKGVLQAAKHAQKAVKENRSVNDEVFLRRRDEGESQLDSALQKLVFRQSYRQEFAGQTQYGRVKVGEVPDELGQKIVDRIKKMDDSALTRSLDLRRELGDAMVSLLQTVSQHRRTMPLLEGMARIGDLLRDLAEVEQVPPEEVEPWCRAIQDYIMHAAVSTIGRQKVGLLEGLQLKLLSDDAPLRAVYAEARALSEEGTDAETALAQQVMELCESMVDGLSRRLGPRSGLAKLDLERLRDGDTVGDGPRTGVKAWLKARSEEKTVGEVPKDPPVKVEQVKVEQVDRKAGDEQALLRARDQWIELIGKVQPEPTEPEEPSPFDDDSSDMTTVDGGDDTGKDYAQLMDDWRWTVTLRERTLKATLDKPVLQYMLDTGCSLSKAVDVFHDLLI